MQHIGQNT